MFRAIYCSPPRDTQSFPVDIPHRTHRNVIRSQTDSNGRDPSTIPHAEEIIHTSEYWNAFHSPA